MSKKATFLIAVMAVMSLALSAIAAPSVDTLLTAGYDSDEMALVFGHADHDPEATAPNPCEVPEDAEAAFVYEADDEGSVTLTGLDGCEAEFFAVDATGPNGQVNHGTVTSNFVHAIKEMDLGIKGVGCLVSALNSLGLDVEQVKANDEDEVTTTDTAVVEEATDYTVALASEVAKCQKPEKPEKPEKAEKSEKTEKTNGSEWKDSGDKPGKGKGKDK